ncbi:hypothetical protein [Nonomuraea sp. NEAU-A123]|uniref:hypothetical protein n=1 Tax=Nonomuraea sp. NEAU-A123 TaxID=2839649 RepID=UPI001BE3DA90|nr:hypothetical protein [Nonomuraea sp. NEAU-A123]MBT2234363.1 hypothetical protein [Nonomuraea sp. NEAU-A123]
MGAPEAIVVVTVVAPVARTWPEGMGLPVGVMVASAAKVAVGVIAVGAASGDVAGCTTRQLTVAATCGTASVGVAISMLNGTVIVGALVGAT